MRFSLHSKDRFAERFPYCPLSLEQAYDQSIPFGVETPTTIAKLHPDYKIVFIVEKKGSERILKTILTEDLYYANSQMLGGHHTCKFSVVTKPHNPLTPAERWEIKRKEEENNRRLELNEIKKQLQNEIKTIKQNAVNYAKEKNYVTWQPEFYKEVKERFNLSKNKTVEYFLPAYITECSHYQLFN